MSTRGNYDTPIGLHIRILRFLYKSDVIFWCAAHASGQAKVTGQM